MVSCIGCYADREGWSRSCDTTYSDRGEARTLTQCSLSIAKFQKDRPRSVQPHIARTSSCSTQATRQTSYHEPDGTNVVEACGCGIANLTSEHRGRPRARDARVNSRLGICP